MGVVKIVSTPGTSRTTGIITAVWPRRASPTVSCWPSGRSRGWRSWN